MVGISEIFDYSRPHVILNWLNIPVFVPSLINDGIQERFIVLPRDDYLSFNVIRYLKSQLKLKLKL